MTLFGVAIPIIKSLLKEIKGQTKGFAEDAQKLVHMLSELSKGALTNFQQEGTHLFYAAGRQLG